MEIIIQIMSVPGESSAGFSRGLGLCVCKLTVCAEVKAEVSSTRGAVVVFKVNVKGGDWER